jgi:hypothetical protein
MRGSKGCGDAGTQREESVGSVGRVGSDEEIVEQGKIIGR